MIYDPSMDRYAFEATLKSDPGLVMRPSTCPMMEGGGLEYDEFEEKLSKMDERNAYYFGGESGCPVARSMYMRQPRCS